MTDTNMNPSTPERRNFSRLARAYVASMDLFTYTIEQADAAGVSDVQAQAAKLHANAQRGSAYRELVRAAVRLSKAQGV
jgi:hypothetical protein